MPVYLCHGFRWHRRSIRYFIVLQDVDDAAPEWIVAPRSAVCVLETLYRLFDFLPPCAPPTQASGRLNGLGHHFRSKSDTSFDSSGASKEEHEYEDERRQHRRDNSSNQNPSQAKRDDTPPLPPLPSPSPLTNDVLFNDWSIVKLLEEFDPSNESMVSGPWAYVSDYIARIDTSVSVAEEILRYEERTKQDKNKAISGPSDETGRRQDTRGNTEAGWFEKLRDKLQRGEDIKWYVVVCGDEERTNPIDDDDDNYGEEKDEDDTIKVRRRESAMSMDDFDDEDDFKPRLPEFADQAVRPFKVRPKSEDEIPPPVPEKDYPPTPPRHGVVPEKPAPIPPRNGISEKPAPTLARDNIPEKTTPIPPRQTIPARTAPPPRQVIQRKVVPSPPRQVIREKRSMPTLSRPNVQEKSIKETVRIALDSNPLNPKLAMDTSIRPKTPKSSAGLRKLFSRRNFESPSP